METEDEVMRRLRREVRQGIKRLDRKTGKKQPPQAPDELGPPTPFRMEMQDPSSFLYASARKRPRRSKSNGGLT